MTGENVTNAGATAALASPFWLPSLHQLSAIAAEILPILGAAWLVVQIATKVIETRRKGKQ